MDAIEIVRLAKDSLLSNKMRSALTMLGVIIGVASVILLVSIGEGARTYINFYRHQRFHSVAGAIRTQRRGGEVD